MEFLAYIEVVLALHAVIYKVGDHTALELIMVDLITAELILLIIVDLTTADLTIVDLITLDHTTPDHTIAAPIMMELIVTDLTKADLIAADLPAELFPMVHHGGGSFVDGRSGMGSGFGHRSRGYEDEDDMADRIREMSSIREYDEY